MLNTAFPEEWRRSVASVGLGRVQSLLGDRFEAYLRIMHPAYRIAACALEPVCWTTMAGPGITLEDASFRDVSGIPLHSGRTSRSWDLEPRVGGDAHVTLNLLEHLRAETRHPDAVMLGLWDGYGVDPVGMAPSQPLDLGRRRYLVTAGPLSLSCDLTGAGHHANLFWPPECTWAVACDIDLPSTYVGGTAELIEHLREDPALESVEVQPETATR